MRYVLVVMMIILITATETHAQFGFADNPDRYPSLGISVGLRSAGGHNTFDNLGSSEEQNAAYDEYDLKLDGRLPVTDWNTLFAEFSVFTSTAQSENKVTADVGDSKLQGLSVRVGTRFYFKK